MRRAAAALLGASLAVSGVSAAWADGLSAVNPAFDIESGLRHWYSTGKDSFDLSDVTGTTPVSRLTWTSTTGNSGEAFFRANTKFGLFAKGYVGRGGSSGGNLQDEDFSPFIFPYSSTDSSARGGISYGSIDLGYNVWNTRDFKLGGFVGYHRWEDTDKASGCTQTAGNPFICQPAFPGSVAVITESYTWDALRLGLAGDWRFANRWRLQAEAAYARANATMSDTHWLRLNQPGGFTGATPTDGGKADGVQLEAILSYQLTDAFSLGVGGRYWKYTDSSTVTHFEQTAIPVGMFSPQASGLSSERYGITLEGAYHF